MKSFRDRVSDAMPPASAGLLGSGGMAAMLPPGVSAWAPLLLILGVVSGFIALVTWKGIQSVRNKVVAAVVPALFLSVGFVGLIDGMESSPPGCDPAVEDCTPGLPPVTVDLTIPSTALGSDTDGATEIFDSEGFDGDQESPTPTVCVYGTNVQADRISLGFTVSVSVDNDVATTTASFKAPDMCGVDWQVQLTSPRDANGDGTNDAVSLFMRVRVNAASMKDTNQSSATPNFIWDQFGTYIGGTRIRDTQTTASIWWVAWDGSQSPDGSIPANTWSTRKNIGTTTGATPDFFSTHFVHRNYADWRYTQPNDGFVYHYEWELSGPDGVPLKTLHAYDRLSVRD